MNEESAEQQNDYPFGPFGEQKKLFLCSECNHYVSDQHFCWGSYPA